VPLALAFVPLASAVGGPPSPGHRPQHPPVTSATAHTVLWRHGRASSPSLLLPPLDYLLRPLFLSPPKMEKKRGTARQVRQTMRAPAAHTVAAAMARSPGHLPMGPAGRMNGWDNPCACIHMLSCLSPWPRAFASKS
jgi:hypothetical protein